MNTQNNSLMFCKWSAIGTATSLGAFGFANVLIIKQSLTIHFVPLFIFSILFGLVVGFENWAVSTHPHITNMNQVAPTRVDVVGFFTSKTAYTYYATWFGLTLALSTFFIFGMFRKGETHLAGNIILAGIISLVLLMIHAAVISSRQARGEAAYFIRARTGHAYQLLTALDQWEEATIRENNEIEWLIRNELFWPRYTLNHVVSRSDLDWPIQYREHTAGALLVHKNSLDTLRQLGHPISDVMFVICEAAISITSDMDDELINNAIALIWESMPVPEK